MTTDLLTYLRRYRPGLTREEAAVAAGISIATLTRRLRDGLDADEVMRAAEAVGASPVEALLELGLVNYGAVRAAVAAREVDALSDRVLLETLLARAIEREPADEADREEAGLPPSPPRRFDTVHPSTVAIVDTIGPADEAVIELPRAARHGEHDD